MESLREKIENVSIRYYDNNGFCLAYPKDVEIDTLEKIADEHAIGFAEWKDKHKTVWIGKAEIYTPSVPNTELLAIYKKEQELNGLTK